MIFACSCCSVARSVRYVFASCPLQKQPVARFPCCFRLQAPFAKTTVCIALAISWIPYAICCLLYAFHALHAPFFHVFFIFFENLLPALVGEHDFENNINVKSHKKTASPALQSHGLHLFWNCLWHWNLQNQWDKTCISRLCALFGSFVCPYVFNRMHFA